MGPSQGRRTDTRYSHSLLFLAWSAMLAPMLVFPQMLDYRAGNSEGTDTMDR